MSYSRPSTKFPAVLKFSPIYLTKFFLIYSPLHVVNSASLAFADCIKDSETIIGVHAMSHPYLRTSNLKGNLGYVAR